LSNTIFNTIGLLFDVEQWVQVKDDGSATSADYAADVFELILGLVRNGELHVWALRPMACWGARIRTSP